jgi:putative peptide zinc metalloprotease protein
MNLAEALTAALPEIPIRNLPKDRPLRLDPNLIIKEQTQDGKPMVMVVIPSTRRYYPLTHEQWGLLSLFDGIRTCQEIAALYTDRTSVLYTEEYVRGFVESIADQPFWYKTAQEQNIALWEKLKEERRRRTKKESRFGNLAEITFSAWDPNVYGKLKFIFTRGFLIFNLILFAFMAYVWIDRWGEIGHDTLEFFTFTHKGLWDLVEFWLLIFVVGFVHESSHGLACKHTGGEVHRMGFMLIYLEPCFFCDVTEAWIFGSKWQRIMTMAAGLWSELILCGFATILWWGLPPGGFVHEFAYKIILIAGLFAVFINLNPLIKLDGYFILTEMLEVSELKELSTDFTTSWVKKKILRLPVEVPLTPWKRRLLFVPYYVLSNIYGYVLLFFIVTFVYNLASKTSTQWAFVPALGVGWLMFRGRIRSFLSLVHRVYLDKNDLIRAKLKSQRAWAFALFFLCLLFAPIWKENVSGEFVLEPMRSSVIRSRVPGQVVDVEAQEGQVVSAATPLIRMRDLKLESELAQLEAEYQSAAYRVTAARLRNAASSSAEHEREELSTRLALLHDEATQLVLTSEIPGSVVTPRLQDLLGSYLNAGTELAVVADLSAMKARIYVAETDLRNLSLGSKAKLHVAGMFPSFEGTVVATAPDVSAMEPGIMDEEKYAGLHAPHFYFADIKVANPDGNLKIGMIGAAKIFVRHRSLVGLVWEFVANFVSRKVW